MANDCNDINPLQHSGTSRLERVLRALSPASAPIDGRGYGDLILFARQYASLLRYYDDTNAPAGDWQPLMQMDIAVILATLAGDRMPLYETYRTGLYRQIFQVDILDVVHQADNETLCRKLLETVFDLLFTYLYHLDDEYRMLAPGSEEAQFIHNVILGKLKDASLQLRALYQQVQAAGLVIGDAVYLPGALTAPTTIRSAAELLTGSLGADWQGPVPLVPDLTVGGIISQIKNLVTHNLFNAVTDTILKSIGTISGFAATRLDTVLTDFPSHTPHYALFLTFLQLFRHAQDDLNTLTERHLQFYYQDVLQQKNRAARNDQAHLIIDLQKNTDHLIIPGGTAFKAGKDPDGQEIYYATASDFTVNQAGIKSLEALYTQTAEDTGNGSYQTLYQSTVANSKDGAGAAPDQPDGAWFPFGNPKTTRGLAETGFAIASRRLYLGEGKRLITTRFTLDQNIPLKSAVFQNAFQIKMTGEKGWVTIDPASVTIVRNGNTLSFAVTLDPALPAIIGFSPGIHSGLFPTGLPVMRCIVTMAKGVYNPLGALGSFRVTGINLEVRVEGLKKIQVATDSGAVDPAKPFMPFTASPHIGSSVLIGSKEVFEKPLTDLELMIQWDKLPPEGLDIYEKKNDLIYNGMQLQDALAADSHAPEDPNVYFGERTTFEVNGLVKNIFFRKHTVLFSWLRDGIWTREAAPRGLFSGKALFSSGDFRAFWLRPPLKYARTVNLGGGDAWQNNYDFIACPHDNFRPAVFGDQNDEKYSVTTKNGFLRLELSGDDFAHDAYQKQLLQVSVTTTPDLVSINNRPDPPYTPVIKSLELNYTASGSLDLSGHAGEDAFFLVYPFGIRQETGGGFPLLPVFANEGELYIGLDGIRVPGNVSMLFQVSEGSADPTKEQEPVAWHYLASSNQWLPLDAQRVEDHTNGLLQSGLILFSLPGDLAGAPLLMGGSLSWIRASVPEGAEAICKILSIQTQGIRVEFRDLYHTGNEYKAPVAAGIISKLVVSNALIKKISQPYDSFGGRPRETNPDFEVRVSERLRHKGRAITIWDYEHLVLEQFPEIYKVKCLNHTGRSGAGDWNEAWPGHVTMIPVPDLKNKNAVDPLLPYTPLGTLAVIQEYLETLVSPFVKLHVVNPLFEEVQLDFKVRFLKGYDLTVFAGLLNEAIEQFLSPWAFGQAADIEFGGRIAKSVVLKFIEDQYYVDYVSCFKMNHWIDVPGGVVEYNVEEAVASTSRSILVSFHNPDTGVKHLIQPIQTETATCDCS